MRIIGIEMLAVLVVATAYGSTPFVPDDPLFAQQWNLAKQSTGAVIDTNILGAWAQGWTGQGVRIGVVENGSPQSNHPDLAANYSPAFDLVSGFWSNHATSVAGIAAGRGGNGLGITGAAPYASLSFVDVDFPEAVFDQSQADAARYRNDAIDIKNWSILWDGDQYLFSSHPLYAQGILDSEAAGTINVRCAGNDIRDVNAFPDKNFFGQIIVGGIGAPGTRFEWSNHGANLTVTAPTQRAWGELGITTTTIGSAYTNSFNGTSAAAPLVSGILAVTKEAQPALDTRMAKHLLARTSRVVDPNDPRMTSYPEFDANLLNYDTLLPLGTWRTNTAGIHFSHDYGFGLIDATAMVNAAQEYSGVTPLVTASTGTISVAEAVPEDGSLTKTFTITETGQVEDIQFEYSLTGLFKSGTQMSLISPAGTVGLLMSPWQFGETGDPGTRNWSVVTNAFWGEEVAGEWTIKFADLPWNSVAEMGDQVMVNSYAIVARIGALVPASPGDFNADGVVDVADYMKWRDGFGSTINLAADDSGNGIVDAADYVIWRSHVGSGIGTVVTVPEPQGMILLAGSSMLFVRRSRLARLKAEKKSQL